MAAKRKEDALSSWHSMPTGGGEPSAKHLKTDTQGYTWADDRVVCSNLVTWQGISSAQQYERQLDQPQYSLKNILTEIDSKTTLTASSAQKFFFYGAFKTALKDLLAEIDSRSCEILLIHGMSSVGKSSLATCLSYYLALEGKSATLVKMDGTHINNETAVTSLCEYFTKGCWLIYDQCNLNNLLDKEADFARGVYCRNEEPQYKKPVIMFTSGHYSPQECWDNDDNKIKLIDMQIDESVLDFLKKDLRIKVEVNNQDVLSVSRNFGRVQRCLYMLKRRGVDVKCDFASLLEHIYMGVEC